MSWDDEQRQVQGDMPDHVHMVISIQPKYAVSSVIGYTKGKSAIALARDFEGCQRNFTGQHFQARGYFVSAVGLDEEAIKNYVENQMSEDIRLDKWNRYVLIFGFVALCSQAHRNNKVPLVFFQRGRQPRWAAYAPCLCPARYFCRVSIVLTGRPVHP